MVENARRTYVFGDIHGRLHRLDALLNRLPLQEGDCLIFVGDYIDRGLQSKEVIDRLIALKNDPRYTTIFLMGNHEEMFLEFLGNEQILNGLPPEYLAARTPEETRRMIRGFRIAQNGGPATLQSYGYAFETPPDRIQLPDDHVAFYRDLKLSHQTGNALIVHAGVDIHSASLAARTADDLLRVAHPTELLWSRQMIEYETIDPVWEFTVICGHTPQYGRPLVGDKFVCIDLGAAYDRELCALCLEDEMVYLSGGVSFPLRGS